jgi:hypothetical protein
MVKQVYKWKLRSCLLTFLIGVILIFSLTFSVAVSKKGDFLPSQIIGDNSATEFRKMTDDLMLQTVWQKQVCEEEAETCNSDKAIANYFKGSDIPEEVRALFDIVKTQRLLAQFEERKKRRQELNRDKGVDQQQMPHLIPSLSS